MTPKIQTYKVNSNIKEKSNVSASLHFLLNIENNDKSNVLFSLSKRHSE